MKSIPTCFIDINDEVDSASKRRSKLVITSFLQEIRIARSWGNDSRSIFVENDSFPTNYREILKVLTELAETMTLDAREFISFIKKQSIHVYINT